MADKYISLLNGIDTEVEATVIGGNVSKAGDIVALDASGRLDESVMPVGIGADVASVVAAETLQAGRLVYINASGQAALASAAVSGFAAKGFVRETYNSAQTAMVYFEGRLTGLTGLTPGARYYLSDATPGTVTNTPVSGTGKKHQFIGCAIDATSISFEADDYIVRA